MLHKHMKDKALKSQAFTIKTAQNLISKTNALIRDYAVNGLKRPSHLSGPLGELYVYEKVLEKDPEALLLSGQSGVDIKLSNGARIEVKTARYNTGLKVWGFGRIMPEKFDYLVCVALKDNSTPEFIVFTKKEAQKLPMESDMATDAGRPFKNQGQTFWLFSSEGQSVKNVQMNKINSGLGLSHRSLERIFEA